MDMDVYLTKQTTSSSKSGNNSAAVSAGNNVLSKSATLNFMDLIFARLTSDTFKAQKAEQVALQQKQRHPLLQGTTSGKINTANGLPELANHGDPITTEHIIENLLENSDPGSVNELLAALPSEIATEISARYNLSFDPATIQTTSTTTGQKNTVTGTQQKLIDFLKGHLHALPQDSKNQINTEQLIYDETLTSDIPLAFSEGTAGDDTLIAAGLTPEKLTEIIKHITNGDEQGEALVIGLVKILPPETKKEAMFLPRGVVVAGPQHPAGDISTPQDGSDIASRLNSLTAGDEAAFPLEENDFDGVLRVLERAQGKGVKAGQSDGSDKGIENAIKQIKQHVGAGLSTFPGIPPALSAMFTEFAPGDIFPDGWDFASASAHSLNLTGPAQLTSIISHIQQAGIPHPATQMVASTIAKATMNGENKNITIQLDPPDLGKVSVRMEFSKEHNSVKALLVAEKPETYLMLQRDAHVLERALQDAGLDADGGLSFELSQDGNMFGQDEHSTGGHSGGGADGLEADENDSIEIIETHMDWYVDPETGAMRYDALV